MAKCVDFFWLKFFLFLLTLNVFLGCSTIQLPKYIPDHNPYEKVFYHPYQEVLNAVAQTIEESGWTIVDKKDPKIYEHSREASLPNGRQVVLFTDLKKNRVKINSSGLRLNAFVSEARQQSTLVELRCLTVMSTGVKKFYDYRQDDLIGGIWKRIDAKLEQ